VQCSTKFISTDSAISVSYRWCAEIVCSLRPPEGPPSLQKCGGRPLWRRRERRVAALSVHKTPTVFETTNFVQCACFGPLSLSLALPLVSSLRRRALRIRRTRRLPRPSPAAVSQRQRHSAMVASPRSSKGRRSVIWRFGHRMSGDGRHFELSVKPPPRGLSGGALRRIGNDETIGTALWHKFQIGISLQLLPGTARHSSTLLLFLSLILWSSRGVNANGIVFGLWAMGCFLLPTPWCLVSVCFVPPR